MPGMQLRALMTIETEEVWGDGLQVGDLVVADDLIFEVTSLSEKTGVPVWSQSSGRAVSGRETALPHRSAGGYRRYRVVTLVR